MTYHANDIEHMAIVRIVIWVFSDVREMRQIVSILTRTIDISYFMLTYRSLKIIKILINSLILIHAFKTLCYWYDYILLLEAIQSDQEQKSYGDSNEATYWISMYSHSNAMYL